MTRRTAGIWGGKTVLLLTMAGLLFPVYWLLKSALSQPLDAAASPPQLVPYHPTLAAFTTVWSSIAGNLVTSAIVAVGCVVIAGVVSLPTAYALILVRGSGSGGWLRFILLSPQLFPGLVFIIPLYSIFYKFHLLNTLKGLIIADSINVVPLGVLIVFTYMLTVPPTLIEAAVVDGAGPFTIFSRIVVPLCRPAVITMSIFAFLAGWNDFLFAVTFGAGRGRSTATVTLYGLIGGNNTATSWTEVMAASIIVAIPALVALAFAQRFIRGGLTAGAVK